mmetsp:Transcript_48070/g.148343  ORF Transcript_48070/g.148343 Transcript_48070/m.148343 type:complete len:227 (-) Transcript_48070:1170-1850(-)
MVGCDSTLPASNVCSCDSMSPKSSTSPRPFFASTSTICGTVVGVTSTTKVTRPRFALTKPLSSVVCPSPFMQLTLGAIVLSAAWMSLMAASSLPLYRRPRTAPAGACGGGPDGDATLAEGSGLDLESEPSVAPIMRCAMAKPSSPVCVSTPSPGFVLAAGSESGIVCSAPFLSSSVTSMICSVCASCDASKPTWNHGCWMISSIVSRFAASTTRIFEMRSLAPSVK